MRMYSPLAPCLSQQLGWPLATVLGITVYPFLFATPSGAQTRPKLLPSSNGLAATTFGMNDRWAQTGTYTAETSIGEEDVQPKLKSIKTIRSPYTDAWFREGSSGEQALPSTSAQDLMVMPSSALDEALSRESAPTPVTIGQRARREAPSPNSFFFGFGVTLPPPTALQGLARPVTVTPQSNEAAGIAGGVRLGFANLGGNNQTLTLGIEGGEQSLGFDLDFRQFFEDGSGYAVNFANRRGVETEFDRGGNDVDTPNGDDPWVHRLGGGIEYFRSLEADVDAALGISYQRISVRDAAFTSDVEPEDESGNRLTVSDDGQDDLLTLNFAGTWDRRDNPLFPTEGFRLLFGMDQSIPVGDASILFNRLSANYTQFIPLDLFGFTEGPRTLVLNVQGGTIIGDAPPYEAFTLGGASSVRGYEPGALGTGRSFVQATAEYRFPLFDLNVFREDIDVGGTLFFDYATDLGSGDTVIGEPAEVRDKPGSGFGYGLGLRALTPIGPIRLEFGLNDEGDSEIIFNIGDRF